MQIILRGPAAGYEAEHTARLFFPDAEKTENLPQLMWLFSILAQSEKRLRRRFSPIWAAFERLNGIVRT